MPRVSDEAVRELFAIARQALDREDQLLRSAMQDAHRAYGCYAAQAQGIAALYEPGPAYVVYRALMQGGSLPTMALK